jgi:hypothetical protein
VLKPPALDVSWLLWDFEVKQIRGKHVQTVRK